MRYMLSGESSGALFYLDTLLNPAAGTLFCVALFPPLR